MPKLTVDGIEVEVPAAAAALQACEAAGKGTPRFCFHETQISERNPMLEAAE